MPIIFLDIDGVLNRTRFFNSTKPWTVDTALLDNLKQLISQTNAQVVLASTWRHEAGGITVARRLGVPFEDILPDLRPKSRGDEVRQWLSTHSNEGRFIVIDDDDDGYESLPLFQPNPRKGLTPEIARAAAAYLNGKTDRDWRRSFVAQMFESGRSLLLGHRG
jgi:Swiss Army Knife RNA repair-like protein